MLDPSVIAAMADAMHKHGVRRVVIGDVEIEIGDRPESRAPFDLEDEKKHAGDEKKRSEKRVYGGSY